ncbi:terminase small subunit [Clostridium gasigenes]|uniref:terminase small subunit n=1 Tax=Clostridium gasigenes TaxID=94869 RepID=UPI001C0B7340|nr:terminase small subunit [Clostridium gasigenes]MBU3102980.1 terminase small subunit [Clostridium gasigenes]
MARARSPAREKAREIYLKAKGNIKLLDIAKELGVLDTQIRKWKSQDKWQQELKGTLPIEKENKKKGNVTKKKKVTISDEVKEVLDNTELNDKQKLFCVIYAKCFNATKSYQKAYECDYITANTNGPRLLVKACVRKEVKNLKEGKLNRAMLSEDDVFQRYMDIAFADITDFLTFGEKEEYIRNSKGEIVKDEFGNPSTRKLNYVSFRNAQNVDGTLISEVRQGKDGVSIKLQDKMRALQWLGDRLDLVPNLNREKLELEKEKVRQVQEKMDYERNKNNNSNEPISIIIKRKGED